MPESRGCSDLFRGFMRRSRVRACVGARVCVCVYLCVHVSLCFCSS